MGMGDKKIQYEPTVYKTMCDVTKKEFYYGTVRRCQEPNVIKHYGENVSLYICKKCKYVQEYPMFGGISCKYEVKSEQPKSTTR